MQVDVREAKLGVDMCSTRAITTATPHMFNAGGAVSFGMNAWMASGQGGGEGNKVGWWRRQGHLTCRAGENDCGEARRFRAGEGRPQERNLDRE